jgi:uncharacterized SAM-binding protein YcdF (DUF218 family)
MFLIKLLLRLAWIISGGLLFIVLIYATLLYLAYPKTPEALIKEDPIESSDVIVFLGGESNRFDYALELFHKGYSSMLYSPGGEYPRMIQHIHEQTDHLKGAILVMSDIVAKNTYDEAINTSKFMRNHHLKSIILVTSSYHTYRARWIFKQVLPNVRILATGVPYDKSTPSDAVFNLERSKFLGYYILYSWPVKWLGVSQQRAIRLGKRFQRLLNEG